MLLPLYFVTYLLPLPFYLLCQAPNNRQLHCFAVAHCPEPVTPCKLYHFLVIFRITGHTLPLGACFWVLPACLLGTLRHM